MREKSDSVFHFKQFDVENRASAMRVNTDGVLLGAWADVAGAHVVWDAGCGTGLISLMAAQRNPAAKIFGIEIEHAAACEADGNFKRSPWSERLKAVEGDLFEIYESLLPADVIVCNPPFFTEDSESLRSPDPRRCLARHAESLSCGSIVALAAAVLPEHGKLCMVAPASKSDSIETAAVTHRLNVEECCTVMTSAGKEPKRMLWRISRKECTPRYSSLVIHLPGGSYSEEYVNLVSDFYLNL